MQNEELLLERWAEIEPVDRSSRRGGTAVGDPPSLRSYGGTGGRCPVQERNARCSFPRPLFRFSLLHFSPRRDPFEKLINPVICHFSPANHLSS